MSLGRSLLLSPPQSLLCLAHSTEAEEVGAYMCVHTSGFHIEPPSSSGECLDRNASSGCTFLLNHQVTFSSQIEVKVSLKTKLD